MRSAAGAGTADNASRTSGFSETTIDAAPEVAERRAGTHESIEPASVSRDPNPPDRSMDRLLVAMGLIEDAAPLFAPAENLPRAGVLLAIPRMRSASAVHTNGVGFSLLVQVPEA